MSVPKLRFKREDGMEYPEWETDIVGNRITIYDKKVAADCTLPILTSSKTNGIEYQSDHFGREQNHDIDGYNVLPRGYATYRNRSDNRDFTFNINNICDEGIISKFYPVFTSYNCDLIFLIYLLNNSPSLVKEIGYTAIGTGQKVLSISDFKSIKVFIPDIEEQQKIADFLSALDDVITQSGAEVQNLEQQKKAVMQKIFSQEVRFKREDGTGYPEWERTKLGNITVQINKKATNTSLPVYSVNNQKGFIPQVEQFEDREVASKDKSNYREVSFNQFAYNPSRINVGSIAYLKEYINVIVSPLYVVFECLPMANPAFIDSFVRTSLFDVQRKMNTAGSVRDSLSYDGFSSIIINLPHKEEQAKIADFLSAYDEAIGYAKQELEHWKLLKKGLLQQMFV